MSQNQNFQKMVGGGVGENLGVPIGGYQLNSTGGMTQWG
jgi:hypothetical protein